MKPIQLLLRWDNWRQRRWRRFWEIRKLRLPKIFSFQFPKRFSTRRWHHSPPHMPRLREGFNEGLRRWGKVLPAEMGCIKRARIYFLSIEFTHLLWPLQKLVTHTVRGCPWCFSGYGVEWGVITNDYNIRWVGGWMITERVVQQMITLYYESGGSTQGISYAKFIKGIHRIKRKIHLACI